jgi:hypothetical protein
MADNLDNSQLAEVIAQLKSLNFSHDVLLDAIDDNTKLSARNLLISTQVEGERVDNGGHLLAVVTSMRRMVSDISRSSKELLEFFTSNDMQQEENRKDLLAAIRGRDEKKETAKRITPKKAIENEESGLIGILAFAAGLVGGTVVGFVTETARMFDSLIQDSKIYKSITSAITKIRNILTRFGKLISSIAEYAGTFLSNTKIGTTVLNAFKTIRTALTSLFSNVEKGIGIIENLEKVFPAAAEFLGNIFNSFMRGFKAGLKLGEGIAKALPKIFKVLKALAKPLVWIMAGFEAVMGAIEGYKEGGIMGGIKGAISGFLIGFAGGIADLVKDIISWIANLLGFESFSEWLDSFSFSQFIKDGVNVIFDTVAYAFDWFKSIFSFDKFSAAFENFGIAGLWSTLAGGILDTLKGAVSWIATMFGAFDLSIALDNFSFTDSINKGLEIIFALPAKIWNWITTMFSWDNLSKLFEDFSLSGLFTDFYGTVLDTLKGAVSWMASLLGFDGISKYLDSFSFTDIFKSVFDAVDEAINSMIDWIMNIPTLISELAGQVSQAIGGAVSGIGNLAEGFSKSILKDVLPDPAAHISMVDPIHWVAKAIPDNVYEYAGIKAVKSEEITPLTTGGGGTATVNARLQSPGNTTGAELLNSGSTTNASAVIVNNYGGNTTNTTQSSVNNNTSSYDPIMTGSAMGFASI